MVRKGQSSGEQLSVPQLHFKSSLNNFLLTLKNEGDFKLKYMYVVFMASDAQIEICLCICFIPLIPTKILIFHS